MLLHKCYQTLARRVLDFEYSLYFLEMYFRLLPRSFKVVPEAILKVLVELWIFKRSAHSLQIAISLEKRSNLNLIRKCLLSKFVSVKSGLDSPLVSLNRIIVLEIINTHICIVLSLRILESVIEMLRMLLKLNKIWLNVTSVYFNRFLAPFYLNCIYMSQVFLAFFC